jgi:transcriptional regulator with XRE-family HTH domain
MVLKTIESLIAYKNCMGQGFVLDFNLLIWFKLAVDKKNKTIAERIKALRKTKKITQAELDQAAGLPVSSTSKIENGKREATAEELIRISKSLGTSLNAFSSNEELFVYSEEVKVIEALREINFEDYRHIIRTIESRVYFTAKDSGPKHKEHLQDLVASLSNMTEQDQRPRSHYAKEVKRVRK